MKITLSKKEVLTAIAEWINENTEYAVTENNIELIVSTPELGVLVSGEATAIEAVINLDGK